MKIFLDTNIWLRYLVGDKKTSYEACRQVLELNEIGKFRSYTSSIVLLELNYVLLTYYKIKKSQVMVDIGNILTARNLVLIEKTDFSNAVKIYKKTGLKLGDCLIAAQIPKDIIFCTYDKDFKKIKTVKSLTPEEILQTLAEIDYHTG